MTAPGLDRAVLTAELPGRLAGRAPRVVVLGDTVLDLWLAGPTRRLSREAPVPVVEVERTRPAAGGAANTAANLAALGARTTLVSLVGTDPDAATVLRLLAERGVDTAGCVADPDRETAAKRRILADDALVARYDTAPAGPVGRGVRAALVDALSAALADPPDAVVVCDYDGGTFGDDVVSLLADPDRPWRLILDAHDLARWAPARPDVVTPNAGEVATLLGRELRGPDRAAAVEAAAGELRARCGAATLVVTLDRDGALLVPDPSGEAGQAPAPAHRTFARPAPDSRSCGAGDSFTAGLALGLAAGVPVATAVELAQAAADVVVTRPGTAVCSTAELTSRVAQAHGSLLDGGDLERITAEHRSAGRRVVFTNGCFDVVHRGHVAYLNQAKRLGDVLVVALNTDDGVGRLTGPDRPLNALADRAAVIGALSCVDHVVSFAEDTPIALLEATRPDVYAKGGDYTPEMLRETPVVEARGGRVVILDYLPGRGERSDGVFGGRGERSDGVIGGRGERSDGVVEDSSTSAIVDRVRSGAPRE